MSEQRASGFTIRGLASGFTVRGRGLAVAVAACLLAAACGGGTSSSGSGTSGGSTAKSGGTLTVVTLSPPASLDPAKANVGSDNWFVNLAYDTLTRMGPGGKLEPDLAVKWGYVGTGNTDFQLTLRSGVTFADGTPVDAKAVAASLDYVRKHGLNVSWTSAVSSVTATGPLTVDIKCDTPNPVLAELFDQVSLMGSVISPAGLADPSKLGTRSFGAGPYVLDTAQSASGDHYTYTPNPKYWDQSKIHWQKVVVKVVANPNSALQSVKTGEADALGIIPNQVDSAKSAGLTVVHAPIAFLGIILADRDGTVAKPLMDVRVRQALNYAVDRAAITKAVFGDYGTATSEIAIPGEAGFAPDYNDHYTYDLAKAKQLMADAGYPNGFNVKVETQQGLGMDVVTQAVLQQWKALGVTSDVTTDTTIGQWLGNATSKQFPVLSFGYGAAPSYLVSLDWMLPHVTAFNPFASSDPQLQSMLELAAAAPPDQQAVLYQSVMRYVVDNAWFVAVSRIDGIFAYNGRKLTGFTSDPQDFLPDLAWAVTPK